MIKEQFKKIFYLSQTKTAKNAYLVFMGNCVAGFIGMILMIFLSRILGPKSFGVFSVSFSLLSLLSKFGDFGFNFAMIKNISQSRARNEKHRPERIFLTVFWSKALICLALAFLGFFAADYITSKILNTALGAQTNRWLMTFFFVFVFYDLVRVFFEANKRFLESSLVYIVANFFKLILVLLFFFIWPGFQNYIYFYLLGPFFSGLVFFRRTKIRLHWFFDSKEFRKLLQFSSWMAVSVIFAAIGENLNVFMLASKLSAFETGIYAAAEKFILPFSLFANALGVVLISRTSEFLELSHLKSFIKKVLVLQLLLFLAFILVFPLTPLLPLVLGSEYAGSVGVLQVLLGASLFQLASTPLNSVFYPLGKSIIFAIDSIIKVVLIFLLNQTLVFQFQAKGAALSLLITNIVIFFFNYFYLYFILKNRQIKSKIDA